MRKFSFLLAIGLLAVWTAGCNSDSGTNQASPTPSPAPSGASPSPIATATGSPSATPSSPFASPLVTPKSTGATAATGLIQSTNPDERARQAQSGIDTKNGTRLPSPPISTTKANPNPADPFSVLPPQTVQNVPPTNVASSGSVLPKLQNRQVPLLPALPTPSRPVQIGGAKLTGAEAGPIRLSPLAQGVVNEFSTLHNLLDETTTFSDYTKDLDILRRIIYGEKDNDDRNSTRRQLLLTNRPLFRRLEKSLNEYEFAEKLWSLYGQKSPSDSIRCSSLPDVELAIQIYRPITERRGKILCVARNNMLKAVWTRGKTVVDYALRDQDFQGPSIAKSPTLPVLTEGQPLPTVEGDKAFGRDIASVPSVPVIRPPKLGGTGPIEPPSLPEIPPAQAPALPDPADRKSPLRWDNPSQRPPGGPGYQPRRPGSKPGQPEAPLPPPPPSTDIAQAIEISGVVQVGNQIQIIVKVPTEATSRYVKVGQRVANGQVLIKRVQFKRGGDPIVILEENGVEVTKVVGEKPPQPDKKAG